VLAVLPLALGMALTFAPGADAEPHCPGGEQPPCHPPPQTTTTTRPRPPAPQWTANIAVTALPGASFHRPVIASWARAGSPGFITAPVPVAWTDAAQTRGTVSIVDPQAQLPAGNVRGFYMNEQGSSGPLCRSQPFAAIPPTGRNVDVLVAPAVTATPAQLNQIAAGLVGPISPAPQDTSVTITSATIEPLTNGLQVTVHGHLSYDAQFPIPNVDASFAYTTRLGITMSRSIENPNEMLIVNADEGILQLTGDGVTDDIELALAGNLEPTFRNVTRSAAYSGVTAMVDGQPSVALARSLGYTVSARQVSITVDGVQVLPSACKLT
jgi:hypothetical protein